MSQDHERVTLHGIGHDGTSIEIEMPRWAAEAIGRRQSVAFRGGGAEDWELLVDEEGNVTRWHTLADADSEGG